MDRTPQGSNRIRSLPTTGSSSRVFSYALERDAIPVEEYYNIPFAARA